MTITMDELIAREEIRQCVLRHFRAADRVDAELERRAFWDDGHFVGGPLEGSIVDNAAMLAGVLGEAKFAEVGHRPGERCELLVGARYAITLHRRDGAWKIWAFQPVVDWTRVQAQAGIVDGGMPAAILARGQRDSTDATYFGRDWSP